MRGEVDLNFRLNQQIADDLADTVLKRLGLVVHATGFALIGQLLAEFAEELLETNLVQIAHERHLTEKKQLKPQMNTDRHR